ncbi:hypothetical protein N4G69_20185 [Streptomyces mirabilis]|uniref:hypothetical protein n=1 Tax=Streptomyces mirabilis TaxID=68239 RepID=UPI0021BF42AE|nr:hypothetical protein [Streptomyces mirabilis]MCT9107925.1 hypothetical protein [Streptomyces mirabilis]
MTAPWPPADLPGLHVDFGEWLLQARRWARRPSARYRCVCGFARTAAGAKDVAVFTASVPSGHRAACRHHTARRAA